MSRTLRNWLVGILIVASIAGAITFAVCLGQMIHVGQKVVSAGGSPPTSAGWILLVLSAVSAWVPASWAKYLAAAQTVAPVIEQTISQIRGATPIVLPVSPIPDPASPIFGDLTELVAATEAWAANKTDKTLERRWMLAALSGLKDAASFKSPGVASAIGLLGNAIINECFGSGTDPNQMPAGR